MNTPEDTIRMRDQIVEAVRQAMAERSDLLELERLRLAFVDCQDKLQELQHKFADSQQVSITYRDLSRLRGEQQVRMQEELHRQTDNIAELSATIALLKSALDNAGRLNDGSTQPGKGLNG